MAPVSDQFQEPLPDDQNQTTRAEAIGAILENMQIQDILPALTDSYQHAQNIIPKEMERRRMYRFIDSIGSDEAAWTSLMAKHEWLNEFFRKWSQRKAEEKKKNIPKRERPSEVTMGPVIKRCIKRRLKSERAATKTAPGEEDGAPDENITEAEDSEPLDVWEKEQ